MANHYIGEFEIVVSSLGAVQGLVSVQKLDDNFKEHAFVDCNTSVLVFLDKLVKGYGILGHDKIPHLVAFLFFVDLFAVCLGAMILVLSDLCWRFKLLWLLN